MRQAVVSVWRHGWGLVTAGLVLLVSGAVQAQPSAQDAAAARALFEQARKLLADGKPEQACPKLEESQRLDPGIGTLFNMADCHERAVSC